MNDEINKVLSNVRSGMLNTNFKFSLGCPDSDIPVCALNNVSDINELSNDGDVGNTACSPTSSKGGIASAKTGNVNDRDMAVLALKSRTRISSVYEYQDPTSRSQCRICNRLNRANGLG
uniref:Uncharacterized protein n=1 Tax=Tanacetum cinerariifolium TaxID=118510 RepID=A0A699UP76_TANCI|nr:hypothetical protein [Tanacetum cinerariifolium]